MKAAPYVRISTIEQSPENPENQIPDLDALSSQAPSTRPLLFMLSLAIDFGELYERVTEVVSGTTAIKPAAS